MDVHHSWYEPAILLHILKTVWWRNVALGIMDQCDSKIDLVKHMWVSDLYFMVHWFYLMSLSDLNHFYTLRNGIGRGICVPPGTCSSTLLFSNLTCKIAMNQTLLPEYFNFYLQISWTSKLVNWLDMCHRLLLYPQHLRWGVYSFRLSSVRMFVHS